VSEPSGGEPSAGEPSSEPARIAWNSQPPPPPAAIAPPSVPATAPPASATHRPPRRWIVVLVAALVGIVAVAVAGTVLFFTRTFPPLEATYDFTDDIDDGDFRDAYDDLCSRTKNDETQSSFNEFADELRAGSAGLDVDPFSVSRDGDHATVKFTARRPQDRDWRITLGLVHEGGDWQPCTIDSVVELD
jgi:hypothetical protein